MLELTAIYLVMGSSDSVFNRQDIKCFRRAAIHND